LELSIPRDIARRVAFEYAVRMPAFERCLTGEQGGIILDARRMNTSASASYGFVVPVARRSSRKVSPHHFFGGAAIACLVLGCSWTVYSNIFASSVYPSLNSTPYDVPVINRAATFAERSAPLAARESQLAQLEPLRVVSTPAAIPSEPTLSFEERFAASAPDGVEPQPQVVASKPVDAPKLAALPKPVETPKFAEISKPKTAAPQPAPVQVAAIAPAPPLPVTRQAKDPVASVRDMAQRAKAAVMSIASAGDKPSIAERLWGKPQPHPGLLAFASADASVTGSLGPSQNPALGGSEPRYDRSTAVYDISAHMVYLPDGSKLEAHSGLGSELDDPRSAHIRMRGVTPPHLYDLTPREALFHGVPALRLNPVGGEGTIYGRSGLLAHTFMLGPNGDSNGCVSFRDYNAFLNAYRNQGIKRLAVVARID
jgi:hypothetical protein